MDTLQAAVPASVRGDPDAAPGGSSARSSAGRGWTWAPGANAGLPVTSASRSSRSRRRSDPALVALFFQYGRYLLIASSRPGAQPANLQGIWNDSLKPPWDRKYTVNINTEMNYWLAEMCNLAECHEPLFGADRGPGGERARSWRGSTTARGGWVLHHNTDLWRGAAPINASNHGIWPTGGAWLCQHLWWHYVFTGDEGFLARAGLSGDEGRGASSSSTSWSRTRARRRSGSSAAPSQLAGAGRAGDGADDGPPDHPRTASRNTDRGGGGARGRRGVPRGTGGDREAHRAEPGSASTASCRSGSKTRTTRRTSTGTSRTSGGCIRATRSRAWTPRSLFEACKVIAAHPRRRRARAGRWAGRSTSGRGCRTATTP